MSTHEVISNPVVRFKDYYETFSQKPLGYLAELYASDVVFVDPIHRITNREKLTQHFESICSGLTECRFEFVAESITETDAWFHWNMVYCHPKLNGGEHLQITGASHIAWYDESHPEVGMVNYHEDFYDMGAMIYEHVPLLGRVIKTLKNRL